MIIPAVIPKSLDDIAVTTRRVETFTKEIQIDVVDGVFVENISWPYGFREGKGVATDIRVFTDAFAVEVDLMINDPLHELPQWLDAGVKRAVIHIESCKNLSEDITRAAMLCHEREVLLGVSAGNDTSLDALIAILPHADYVQCMGIAHIGVQGEPFDMRVLERIRAIREHFPLLEISVDGSVNKETIVALKDVGVSRFICGSAILGAEDPAAAYKTLSDLVSQARL